MSWIFRAAQISECESVAELVNRAYRGESSRAGWTTESHLLDGLRTDAEVLREQISRPGSTMLLALQSGRALAGCVHLERRPGGRCYLGMFTVDPLCQGQGLGKALLAAAERFGREEYGAALMEMTVITERTELIQYYERRGYRRSGRRVPFPVHPRFGVLKVPFLEMEILEKALTSSFSS